MTLHPLTGTSTMERPVIGLEAEDKPMQNQGEEIITYQWM